MANHGLALGGVLLNKKFQILIGLLLCAGLSFAKKDVDEGPFQFGKVLSPLSTISMESVEISAYMPGEKLLFVAGGEKVLEILDMANPAHPVKKGALSLPGDASSVTVHGNLVAVSLLNDPEWKMGHVQVMRYEDDLKVLGLFDVCFQPDMITFTPNGKNLLVACEGSPDSDFKTDPPGGIAVLSQKNGAWETPQIDVIGFENLDSTALMNSGVRKTGTQGFAQSLEPEYITVSEDSKWAWVSLQENNAMALFDVSLKKVTDVFPLGYVDHSKPGFGLDATKNKKIEIKNHPLRGLRQPDGIAAFSTHGKTFVLTANEGAPVNDYSAWTDVTTFKELCQKNYLDESVCTNETLNEIGVLTVSNLEYDELSLKNFPNGKMPYAYSFGTRSVSLFDGHSKKLIWDSGDDLEQIISKTAPGYFNWNAKKNKVKIDSRSDDKGCEPENVTVGSVNGKRYAFVGLERMSGIAVFDLTDVDHPKIVDYYMDPRDRGPEGLLFIPAEKSPIPKTALLIVCYEYSKTLTVYKVN